MMIAPAQYRRFAKWWRHGHIWLLPRVLATRIRHAVLSGITLTCAAEHAIPGGATISSHAGHQCLHVWAQHELLGEFAARLTVSSGIDIVVSESIMATPVSACIYCPPDRLTRLPMILGWRASARPLYFPA